VPKKLRLLWLATLAAAVFLPLTASADRSETFGDFTVYYSALSTDFLQPAIARSYGITRSKSRILLNVSVLKKVLGTTGHPVTAEITARATNLNNQLKTIDMRKAGDSGGIYYLGELKVENGEILYFTISVTPEGASQTHTIEFQQQFFTD